MMLFVITFIVAPLLIVVQNILVHSVEIVRLLDALFECTPQLKGY